MQDLAPPPLFGKAGFSSSAGAVAWVLVSLVGQPGLSCGLPNIMKKPLMKCYKLRKTMVNRSEEHTSELQSLMRISYAVFCLNKNNIYNHMIDTTLTSYKHQLQVTSTS